MFIATGIIMWLVFASAQWYAVNSSLPRYCADPTAAVERIRRLLINKMPVDRQGKRQLAVAAKLVFIVPRADGESVDRYVGRLRNRISETCRTP
jgi:hypothetical protein